jgi:beta-glucosidase
MTMLSGWAFVQAGAAPKAESLPMQHPWGDAKQSPDERAQQVVAAMTEDEKFSWLSGPMAIPFLKAAKPVGAIGSAAFYPSIPRLGIPAMQQTDASLGIGNLTNVRPGDNATALPSSLLLGASFDPEMARATGAMIAQEARAKGFNVILAGGANLVREPRGGRNFEYISEDPLLTGVIAGNSVAGIQSQGVISTVKHFAVNDQETGRVMVSSDMSEQAMRESDLLAFQIAIEIGRPGAVMPGYNLVNGEYASESAFLLNDVLKGDWKYPGWVMSDWGAVHSTEKAILAGLDVQSGANLDPQPYFAGPLRDAVRMGRVSQARIDDAVRRQLRSLFAVGVIDNPPVPGRPIDYMAHRLLAQRATEAGLVMLKNEGGLLPFAKGAAKILVIGFHADVGVLSGGGSSSVTPIGSLAVKGVELMGLETARVYHPSSPLQAIAAEAGAASVEFLSGRDQEAAVRAARDANLVIILAEEWRAESLDAASLSLPDDQDRLIASVAKANHHTVVVLETGGAVTMPWLADVPAVIAAFYPGSGGGEAISGVLFGRVNPSGHLPMTFPASVSQLPNPDQIDPISTTSNPYIPQKGGIRHINYDIEGSDVGYRWFARKRLTPLFPFGYGLSFSHFAFSDFAVRRMGKRVVATLTVTNKSDREGSALPQVYARLAGDGGFDLRLLGFQKIWLAPGARREVKIEADPRLLARFNSETHSWEIADGNYEIMLGRDATIFEYNKTIRIPLTRVSP